MATTTTTNEPTILDWLAFALKIRESRKGGSFVMPPMTPEQKAMYDRVNHMLDTTPTQQAFWPILGYDLGHPATLDMAALKRGDIGFTPAQHMSPEEIAKMLANASHPGAGAPPPSTTPSPTGAPTEGAAGDPFGHIGAPAGSSGDPFGNWPAPSTTAHNVTWDDIKKYGPQAVNVANSIISATPGIALGAVYSFIKKLFGDSNSPDAMLPPVTHNNTSAGNLEPAGGSPGDYNSMFKEAERRGNRYQLSIDGHPIYQTTPAQLAGQTFLANQMRGMQGNGTGTPEGQGIGQPGFGYGLDYGNFYSGGADNETRQMMRNSPQRAFLSPGQRV